MSVILILSGGAIDSDKNAFQTVSIPLNRFKGLDKFDNSIFCLSFQFISTANCGFVVKDIIFSYPVK